MNQDCNLFKVDIYRRLVLCMHCKLEFLATLLFCLDISEDIFLWNGWSDVLLLLELIVHAMRILIVTSPTYTYDDTEPWWWHGWPCHHSLLSLDQLLLPRRVSNLRKISPREIFKVWPNGINRHYRTRCSAFFQQSLTKKRVLFLEWFNPGRFQAEI